MSMPDSRHRAKKQSLSDISFLNRLHIAKASRFVNVRKDRNPLTLSEQYNLWICIFVGCLLVVALSGCSTIRNTWSKTTDLYETYIDPKPEIDLERSEGVSRKEKSLAVQFSVMDQQLELLLRTLAPQDTFPSSEWVDNLTSRFPWLTAVLAVDTRGEVLAQFPDISVKPIQTAALVEREWSIIERRLQGFVQDTPLGPELIIAGPFFRDGIWMGLLVVHFDPRSLVGLSPDPNNLAVLTPGFLLWSGLDETVTEELRNAPWEEILKSRIQGRWSSTQNTFSWIARPVGDLLLVYAVAL